MKINKLLYLLPITILLVSRKYKRPEYKSYNDYPVTQDNLWLNYGKNATVFKVWSPTAKNVQLHLYEKGASGKPIKTHQMKKAPIFL